MFGPRSTGRVSSDSEEVGDMGERSAPDLGRPGAVRSTRSCAVVIGASMGGLCAARALADHFERVVVVDRDDLPEGPEARRQVPQGRHPHLLLTAGARLLEGWFPGILQELFDGGAVDVDLCADFLWHQAGGIARRPASDLHCPAMSRPFLEWTVRRRARALGNVTVRGGVGAQGLELSDDGDRVTGVILDDGATVPCDLVVDASGRQARTLPWVEAAGFDTPEVSTVEINTRYVSRTYRRTPSSDRDWKAVAVIDDIERKRLAMVLPMEGDRWIALVSGLHGETAPTREGERIAYLRSFPSPVIAELLADCEPLGETVTHRFPSSQRRHVEKLRRFPLGWVLLGDAVSSFNPIYGQGMTSAAQQAQALGECLGQRAAIDRRFARRYFKAASKVVAAPWSIATGSDFAYPDTVGRKPPGTDLINRYMDRVTIAAQHDDEVCLRFNEVITLLRRPEALLAPRFALRVRRAARRGPVLAELERFIGSGADQSVHEGDERVAQGADRVEVAGGHREGDQGGDGRDVGLAREAAVGIVGSEQVGDEVDDLSLERGAPGERLGAGSVDLDDVHPCEREVVHDRLEVSLDRPRGPLLR
jgi:2-polyprenyl-6-methoxyphenol hydroxylase-like FAD-dependent oxidoreductase